MSELLQNWLNNEAPKPSSRLFLEVSGEEIGDS